MLAIAFSYLILPIFYPYTRQDLQTPLYSYLLFINNFWTASGEGAYAPLGPMWSLAIEQQFYLIAPAFILLTGARVATGRFSYFLYLTDACADHDVCDGRRFARTDIPCEPHHATRSRSARCSEPGRAAPRPTAAVALAPRI